MVPFGGPSVDKRPGPAAQQMMRVWGEVNRARDLSEIKARRREAKKGQRARAAERRRLLRIWTQGGGGAKCSGALPTGCGGSAIQGLHEELCMEGSSTVWTEIAQVLIPGRIARYIVELCSRSAACAGSGAMWWQAGVLLGRRWFRLGLGWQRLLMPRRMGR